MTGRLHWLLLLLAIFGTGCSQELNRRGLAARQTFATSLDVFLRSTCAAQNEALAEVKESNRLLRQESIRLRDEAYFARHTNAQGRLVSLNDAGQEVPLSRADLDAFMKSRDAELASVGKDDARFAQFVQTWKSQIDTMLQANAKMSQVDIDVQEANESAAAALNSALSAVGGVAAGVGLGVVAAP